MSTHHLNICQYVFVLEPHLGSSQGGSCSSLLGTAGNVCDSSCGCQTGQLMFLIFKCDEYWENIYFR